MDQNRFLFIQIQTLSPSMQWREIVDTESKIKQPTKNNREQTPTESPIEFKDNSQ